MTSLRLKLAAIFTCCTAVYFCEARMQAQTISPTNSTAHVIESRLEHPCFQTGQTVSCVQVLTIKAIIDGHTYWLSTTKGQEGVLELGDYPISLVKDEHIGNHTYRRLYRMDIGKGSGQEFVVTGETK